MAQVICIGTVVYDQVFSVPQIPAEPVKILATDHGTSGGGMAATAAMAIAALGGESVFWGRVGEDAAGATLCGWMTAAGVDATAVRRVRGGQTATSAILVDPAGERLLAAYPGAGLGEDPMWLPLDAIAEADAVLCDIRWNAGAIAALEAARQAGVPTVLDADLAPRESLRRLLELSDHAIFSERCLTDYAGTRDHHTALLEISRQTAAQLAVTLGEKGVDLLRGGRLERIPAYAVSVRGTNGAGDVFHGAYALSIAEGSSAPEAAAFANAAAAIKCSLGGGWTGMPNRSLVDNLMKANFHASVGG